MELTAIIIFWVQRMIKLWKKRVVRLEPNLFLQNQSGLQEGY
jgi:hypothetical protein